MSSVNNWREREANRLAVNERARERYRDDPEYRERRREISLNFYYKDVDESRRRNKEYQDRFCSNPKNVEARRKRARDLYKNDPEYKKKRLATNKKWRNRNKKRRKGR